MVYLESQADFDPKEFFKDPEIPENVMSGSIFQIRIFQKLTVLAWVSRSILTGEQIKHGDKRVSDVILGTGTFIRRESMLGPLMIYPWLRHLPLFSSQFSKSKTVGPLKMRQLQDDMVATKKVQ